MILSRTPLRLSICGGGTDTPAFYEQSPGAVVSFAIDKFIYVAVNEKFDGRFRVSYSQTENVEAYGDIHHNLVRQTLDLFKPKTGLEIVSVADIPGSGTGLGSSSAFTVGLVNALNWHYHQDYRAPGVTAEVAYAIERECNPHIGKQDHYAAAYGGFNFLRFTKNAVEVTPLEMDEDTRSWLLLLYTGITRDSIDLLRAQKQAFSADKLWVGKGLALLAEAFYSQYQNGTVNIGELLQENWILKKCIHDDVSSSQIDAWYTLARENGAIGGKLCGAGGGGFLLLYAPPDSHERIVKATGLRRVEFKVEKEGSKVVYG